MIGFIKRVIKDENRKKKAHELAVKNQQRVNNDFQSQTIGKARMVSGVYTTPKQQNPTAKNKSDNNIIKDTSKTEEHKLKSILNNKEELEKCQYVYEVNKEYFDGFINNIWCTLESDKEKREQLTMLKSAIEKSKKGNHYSIDLIEKTIIYYNSRIINSSFRGKLETAGIASDTDKKAIIKKYIELFGESSLERNNILNFHKYLIIERKFRIGTIENLSARIKEIISEEENKQFEDVLFNANSRKIDINTVDNLSGFEFEDFLGTLFRSMGYKVTVTKSTGDQGADLVIEKMTVKTVVQAKRYTGSVGNKAVQEVVAARAFYDCQNAMIVTNSYFTSSSVELAKCNNVKLIDRNTLNEYIVKYC